MEVPSFPHITGQTSLLLDEEDKWHKEVSSLPCVIFVSRACLSQALEWLTRSHIQAAEGAMDTGCRRVPAVVPPHGLSTEWQWYLYDSIRQFCPDNDKDTICYSFCPMAMLALQQQTFVMFMDRFFDMLNVHRTEHGHTKERDKKLYASPRLPYIYYYISNA